MSAKMTVGLEDEGREASLEDLEEGECSDDDEPPAPPPPVVEQSPPKQEFKEKEKKREERKEKKHKRRSRSGSRERHKSKKHKRKKGKDKDKEKIEEEEDDETAKKNAMLRKMKMLEGEMGLVESEGTEEQSSGASRSPSPGGGGTARKRKRDKNEWGGTAGLPGEFGRKKWKGPQRRICNLYVQGKCPRDENECLFSHDVDVPKVWELCKFYVYDRCVKRDKCLYLHKEFPCKYFHTGVGCMEEGETCKFSHEPLNDTTRNLLLKHVEAAPKELLGDFPRMSRNEAWQAVSTTEAKNNGWTLPVDSSRRPNSRWDVGPQQQQQFQPDFHGQQPEDYMMGGMNNQGMFNQQQEFKPWGIPKGNKAKIAASSSPSNNSSPKPADLMEIKLNENAIKKFLSSQQKESDKGGDDQEDNTEDEDPWRRGDGDETPEVTPPVSPISYQEEEKEEEPNMPKEHLALYNRIKQKQKDVSSENNYVEPQANSDNDKSESVLNISVNNKASPNRPDRWSLDRQDSRSRDFQASPEATKVASPSQPIISKKGEKKDPRLHKVDPRKERLARKEEEERLEREKDERILSLDLDSVLNDLELPPLTLSSPKHDDDNKYLSDKMGLPFKPHIYHVAKEIDAGLNSHPVLDWVLHPVDVPVRDYSSLRFNFSAAQQDLDPRLRKTPKSSLAVMKELPLPEFTSPKSDPRLKGRPDPRKQGSQNNQQISGHPRRSSEDTEGNHVYNPARELSREKLPVQPPLPPLPRRSSIDHQQPYEPPYENNQGGDDGYGYPPSHDQGNGQDQYYPEEYPPTYDQDYSEPPLPPPPPQQGNPYPMNIQQMQQFSMGLLKDMQKDVQALFQNQQQLRPNFPGRDPRARPGMNPPQARGGFNAPNLPPRMQGFGPSIGQWNQGGFGRPDFRGPRQDFRMPGGIPNNISKRDPRVK